VISAQTPEISRPGTLKTCLSTAELSFRRNESLIRSVIAACLVSVLFGALAQAHVDVPRHQPHEAESRKPHEAISHSPHVAGAHPKPQKAPKHGPTHPAAHPKVAKH
jgi:hypothetical protein